MDKKEIYCVKCYVYQEWIGQTHCANPNCGIRFSNWHLAKQLKTEQIDKVLRHGHT